MRRLSLALALILPIIFNQPVLSEGRRSNFSATKWKVLTPSLTDFLNGGWKLVGQSSHRAATVTPGGIGAIDDITYVYTLFKDGKYVTCTVNNPRADEVTYSGCRSLN